MSHDDTAGLERDASIASFENACERWSLSPCERAMLIGHAAMKPPCLGDEIVQAGSVLPRDAEHRARIVVDVDVAFRRMMDLDEFTVWLRSEDDQGESPLGFMSASIVHLRAMRDAALLRLEGGAE